MHRREFLGRGAATVFSCAATASTLFADSGSRPDDQVSPFPFSVMLWTVEPKLPFDQRIAKVAEAGYHAVELVEEYKDW